MSVKEANSLQALVDRNSEATDTGGFVSLSTVGTCIVFVFGNDIREERLSCIFKFQIIKSQVSLYRIQNEPGDLWFATCVQLFDSLFSVMASVVLKTV